MQIAYYPGCSLHASSQLYDIQCRKVFKRLGIELREIEDWNCCGATSAGKTDYFLSVALPARNLGIADSSGLSEMLIPCSSCYNRTLVTQKILSENGELKNKINTELSRKIRREDKNIQHPRHSRVQSELGRDRGKSDKKIGGAEARMLLWLSADKVSR